MSVDYGILSECNLMPSDNPNKVRPDYVRESPDILVVRSIGYFRAYFGTKAVPKYAGIHIQITHGCSLQCR